MLLPAPGLAWRSTVAASVGRLKKLPVFSLNTGTLSEDHVRPLGLGVADCIVIGDVGVFGHIKDTNVPTAVHLRLTGSSSLTIGMVPSRVGRNGIVWSRP
jgi:hypothetical protein